MRRLALKFIVAAAVLGLAACAQLPAPAPPPSRKPTARPCWPSTRRA